MSVFELRSANLILAILSESQAELAQVYYLANRAHLEPWEPERSESFYALESIRERLRAAESAFAAGTAFHFAILEIRTGCMIGACSFSNVVRGVFQACHLGYSIGAGQQGKGLMFEALETAIKYMFEEVGLHRIMANYMPHNERSARLLQRLGFVEEGYAKSYLKIGGEWRDHVLSSKINDMGA
jgi:ribosomal-protein-alanine N-acetyltransferase